MKKKDSITGFYIETLLLTAVFICVIVLLTSVFARARLESSRAKQLSDAVTLAQNGAEAFAAAKDPDDVFAMLNENGNGVQIEQGETPCFRFSYNSDLEPDPSGCYYMTVPWLPESSSFVSSLIQVYFEGQEEAVYTLKTGLCTEVAQ
ncbi:MAG: hypothetical protein IJM08_06110 [Firmicutes bacterium]|nr:hypothetical protein [Bacillota bacterium]